MDTSFKKVVFIKGLDISFNNKEILTDLNFDLYEGEFCYIVGDSGSGKSSFLKTLYGEESVSKGSCVIDGVELNKISRKNLMNLRRRMGIIFQDFRLFTGWSVYQNLNFVLHATGWKEESKRKQKIIEVLQEVGLASAQSKKVYELSGGMQQKLAIARAILNNPTLLIADEPTGSLDPTASDEIIELIKRIAQKYRTATLFATHDYRLMEKYPARTIKLVSKQLVED